MAVKHILHLSQSICNGIIYCDRRDGGLGFPKLQELVPKVSLLMGLKFTESMDSAIRALADGPRTVACVGWPTECALTTHTLKLISSVTKKRVRGCSSRGGVTW